MTGGGGQQSDEQTKLMVDAWKTTVDVQKHFNDLAMRIRAFALSFLGVVVGASAVAIQQKQPNLATLLVIVGVLAWGGFYLMDGLWYHKLLIGSVKQGTTIEQNLATATKLDVFALTQAISASSIVRFRWRKGGKPRELHSSDKLKMFYGLGTAFLLLLLAGTILLRPKEAPAKEPDTLHVILSPDSAWIASHPPLPLPGADSLAPCCCCCRRCTRP